MKTDVDQDNEVESEFNRLAVLFIRKEATEEEISALKAMVASDNELAKKLDLMRTGYAFIKTITTPESELPKIPQEKIAETAKRCAEIVRQNKESKAQQRATDSLFHAYIVADLAGDGPQKVANLQKALAGLGDTLDTSDAYDFGRFSLITYNGAAQSAVPSCSPGEFKAPDMIAHRSDTRSLGSAYKLLAEQREKEVKPDDCGAMVFTLMNGTPTDDWKQPANRIKELFGPNSIVIDQSGEVDPKVMKEATENKEGFQIKGTEPKDYKKLIEEVGSIVDQTSTRNSTMGRTIREEEKKTSSPLAPVLSFVWDILTGIPL